MQLPSVLCFGAKPQLSVSTAGHPEVRRKHTHESAFWFPSHCEANLLKVPQKKKKKDSEVGAFPSSGWSG